MFAAISVDDVVKLGLPAILGAVAGGLIAHYSAKARGREDHERTKELLFLQDERRIAREMLPAVQTIRIAVHSGSVGSVGSYGQLYNDWSERVFSPSRLIRNDDLQSRASSGLYVISLATITGKEDWVTYAVLRAARDVEDWLEYWLRGDEPPPAHLPDRTEITRLVQEASTGKVSFGPLNDVLIKSQESAEGSSASG